MSLISDQRGSTLIMTLFSAVLSISVLLAAVSVASLYQTHKRLLIDADGAALAASQAFDLSSVNLAGDRLDYRLTDADVLSASREFLANRASHFEHVTVRVAKVESGNTAVVTLRGMWHPPFFDVFLPRGVPVEVTARARGTFF